MHAGWKIQEMGSLTFFWSKFLRGGLDVMKSSNDGFNCILMTIFIIEVLFYTLLLEVTYPSSFVHLRLVRPWRSTFDVKSFFGNNLKALLIFAALLIFTKFFLLTISFFNFQFYRIRQFFSYNVLLSFFLTSITSKFFSLI